MKFKLDENLPLEIAVAFQDPGHEIDTVQSEGLVGAPDVEILDHARTEDRILLTMDKGIADVRLFPPSSYPGIVLFRPATSGRGEVSDLFSKPCPIFYRRVWWAAW
jgi:predicted nuclease of predicted toxin-antitoxin system